MATYIKAFTDEEMTLFAEQWKRFGKLNKRLTDAIIYKATVDIVENKREKEIVEKVAKMQNDMLEGFFLERSKKTVDID